MCVCFLANDCGVIDFACQTKNAEGKGLEFKGMTATHTNKGVLCQNWMKDDPQKSNFKHLNWNHTYCRNPDKEPGGVWCYGTTGKRWEYCDVRECDACDSREDYFHHQNQPFDIKGLEKSCWVLTKAVTLQSVCHLATISVIIFFSN